jgi:sec-independent protein translocase protein TatC
MSELPIAVYDTALPFTSHLGELRKCLIVSAVSIAFLSAVAYQFVDIILRNAAAPIGKLYFISPMEAFLSRLKFSFLIGAFLSAPIVLFQMWQFIQRGLLRKEKQSVLFLTGISFLLFVAGSVFGYYLILPASVSFLMSYGSDVLVPFISVTHYLSFVSRLVFLFGIVFELPLAMWFLAKTGIVHSSALRSHRRLAIVLLFLLAAVLTPTTDAFNQLLMAGPLLVLY